MNILILLISINNLESHCIWILANTAAQYQQYYGHSILNNATQYLWCSNICILLSPWTVFSHSMLKCRFYLYNVSRYYLTVFSISVSEYSDPIVIDNNFLDHQYINTAFWYTISVSPLPSFSASDQIFPFVIIFDFICIQLSAATWYCRLQHID